VVIQLAAVAQVVILWRLDTQLVAVAAVERQVPVLQMEKTVDLVAAVQWVLSIPTIIMAQVAQVSQAVQAALSQQAHPCFMVQVVAEPVAPQAQVVQRQAQAEQAKP
jgi:hypothetical protein